MSITAKYHNEPNGYSNNELKKLGHSIIYLADHAKNLSKTKLLKLVYLLDELSVKKYGIPFFNLEYKVWQAGPVNVDLFAEFSSGPVLLKDYLRIARNQHREGDFHVLSKKKFDDGEFSDNEFELLKFVVKTFGDYTANKLVDLCHRPNTPWFKIAKEKDLLEQFRSGKLNTTDYEIDLSEYLKDDEKLLAKYQEHLEFLNFSKRFKS